MARVMVRPAYAGLNYLGGVLVGLWQQVPRPRNQGERPLQLRPHRPWGLFIFRAGLCLHMVWSDEI